MAETIHGLAMVMRASGHALKGGEGDVSSRRTSIGASISCDDIVPITSFGNAWRGNNFAVMPLARRHRNCDVQEIRYPVAQ
ncbi:hypothetical protein [Devosia enhydra]|uniref:hypothetical protein n=1 Tax=Devosia enhydra TaxID=665118 RepID=UPI0011606B96|nr:hypothetical protein [Devosia enhydra]